MNRQVLPLLLSQAESADWRWQLRNCITTLAQLEQALVLTSDERAGAVAAERAGLPMAITPYYLDLCDRLDSNCPIRRQVVPSLLEHRDLPGELSDPLGEVSHEVAPDLIQRYPDRALLLVNDRCAVYCRFCTRSRWVGQSGGARPVERLQRAFNYLRCHPEVHEVIVSGGDPLTLSTERLCELLAEIRRIPSIETIRVATRVPVTLPHRVTDELVAAMRSFHPIWLMTHFNHARELTPIAREACQRLVDGGFPVMNQTVLLRGINDNSESLSELFRGLIRERVRPYYLLQGDPVRGAGHLRTPLRTGRQLMEQLQGRLSGIALPKFIVDTPGGHGKVPYGPDYVVSRSPGVTRFRSPFGVDVDYLDPPE